MIYPLLDEFVDMWEERHDDGGALRENIKLAQTVTDYIIFTAFAIIIYNLILSQL